MPLIILFVLMLLIAIILLIQKGRTSMLVTNIAVMGGYEAFLCIGAASADGWDGIGWILAALGFGSVHVLVLFILALTLSDLKKEPKPSPDRPAPFPNVDESPLVREAMRRLPAQDRARIKPGTPAPARPTPKAPDSPTAWELKQKRLLERLEEGEGGELPFD
jgi:hypothetical protein